MASTESPQSWLPSKAPLPVENRMRWVPGSYSTLGRAQTADWLAGHPLAAIWPVWSLHSVLKTRCDPVPRSIVVTWPC
jgi:hypothetical protein